MTFPRAIELGRQCQLALMRYREIQPVAEALLRDIRAIRKANWDAYQNAHGGQGGEFGSGLGKEYFAFAEANFVDVSDLEEAHRAMEEEAQGCLMLGIALYGEQKRIGMQAYSASLKALRALSPVPEGYPGLWGKNEAPMPWMLRRLAAKGKIKPREWWQNDDGTANPKAAEVAIALLKAADWYEGRGTKFLAPLWPGT